MNEIEVLRRLQKGYISEDELIDYYNKYIDNQRILLSLVQHPKFPTRLSSNLVVKFFGIDLIRIIRNKRTNPFVRKKAEIEFVNKYQKLPLGEKLSYMKVAPNSLLDYFVEERDKRILEAILLNHNLTEDVLLKFINRKSERFGLYEAIGVTQWYKRPVIAQTIVRDSQASIKMILKIIPFLPLEELKKIYDNEQTHQAIKTNITRYLEQKSQL